MSFHECRNLSEKLRTLGFSAPPSLESFRTPNFPLVASILIWSIQNFDPAAGIPTDIDTEPERVLFIKAAASFLATKMRVKVNTRKLYSADASAVRELAKIVAVLWDALQHPHDEETSLAFSDVAAKLNRLKQCRALASDITSAGANLYDLLGKELELKEIRNATLAKPLSLPSAEVSVKDSIRGLDEQISSMRSAIEVLMSDEGNLKAKIDKKKIELERAEKRLRSLAGVRPAYMDEYEKIEVELAKLYGQYMDKFRNLTFLEQQTDEVERDEQDRTEETENVLKKMQTRLRDEEIRLLKGDSAQRRRGGRRGLDKADGDDDGLFGRDEDDDDEDADLSLDDELDGKGNEESELLSGDNDLSEGEYRPHSLDDNDQEDDVEESDNEF